MQGPLGNGVFDHLLDDALAALAGDVGAGREVAIDDLEPGRTPSFVAAHLKPLTESTFLVNAPVEPSLASELGRELATADRAGRPVAPGLPPCEHPRCAARAGEGLRQEGMSRSRSG